MRGLGAAILLCLCTIAAAQEEPIRDRWERDCRAGNHAACSSAAFEFETVDAAHARQLYILGCEQDPKQCVALGQYADKLIRRGENSAALELLTRACDVEPKLSCLALGTSLCAHGQNSRFSSCKPNGVPPDAIRAEIAYRRSCDAGLEFACTLAAQMHRTGTFSGVAKDVALADQLATRAAQVAHKDPALPKPGTANPNRVQSAQETACRSGKTASCVAAAYQIQDTDPVAAAELFTLQCQKSTAAVDVFGVNGNCAFLNVLTFRLVDQGYADVAILSLAKACEVDPFSCGRLAMLYSDGKAVPKDLDRAARLLQMSCDGGRGPACRTLAERYEKGEGVKRNVKRAQELRAQSQQRSSQAATYDAAWQKQRRDEQARNDADSEARQRQSQDQEQRDIEKRRAERIEEERKDAERARQAERDEARQRQRQEDAERQRESNREMLEQIISGAQQVTTAVGGAVAASGDRHQHSSVAQRRTGGGASPSTPTPPRSPAAAPGNAHMGPDACAARGQACGDRRCCWVGAEQRLNLQCQVGRCCSGYSGYCDSDADCCGAPAVTCSMRRGDSHTVCCKRPGLSASWPGECCSRSFDPGKTNTCL